MVVVANKAKIPKRWKLEVEVGADVPKAEFQGHTSAIEWPSSQQAVTWRGGDDNVITDVADQDQVCNITVAQDLTDGSLYRVMYDHQGKKATLTYEPEYGGPFAVSAEITLMRPPLLTNRGGAIIEHTVAVPSTVPTVVTPGGE